jgi:colicin import membrane protein
MDGITNKIHGYAGTIIVHGITIVALFLITLSASLPDSANEGLLINFGNSEDGFGTTEPDINYSNAVIISLPSHSKPQKVDEKKILTQDFQDAPSIESKKKTEKKEVKKKVTSTTEVDNNKKEVKQVQTTETQKQQTVNKKALFPGKAINGGTGGEGETGKEGNQGSLEGSPDSQNRTGGASGGNGSGEGDGKGVSFNLGGRSALSLPKPAYLKQKQGTVVVQVTVDKQGNVTKAVPGVKGSTTLDNDLLKAAEKAALVAKFDVSPNAPAYQTGTISYIFRLQ